MVLALSRVGDRDFPPRGAPYTLADLYDKSLYEKSCESQLPGSGYRLVLGSPHTGVGIERRRFPWQVPMSGRR